MDPVRLRQARDDPRRLSLAQSPGSSGRSARRQLDPTSKPATTDRSSGRSSTFRGGLRCRTRCPLRRFTARYLPRGVRHASAGTAHGHRPAHCRPPPTEHQIAELVLHSGPRVNRFEEKAAFAPLAELSDMATPAVATTDAVAKGDVVDLTAKMGADGTLDWTPPAGQWVVLRLGYSLLGHHEPSGLSRGDRLRGRQVERRAREELHGRVSRQLQERCWPADGQARPRLPDQRQLGGRGAELDRQHVRRVQEAARLRPASVAARAHGPHRRKCGGQRPVPLGLPQTLGDTAGGVSLRPDHGDPQASAAWATTANRTRAAAR